MPSASGSRKRARNIVSNPAKSAKGKEDTRARNVLAEFPATNRTPEKVEALCREATNVGIATMRETVAALLRQLNCHKLLVYVFAAAHE
jgi:hypothetical protein